MSPSLPSEFYLCLVSYENTGKQTEFIPDDCWGATGWVAVDAPDENELRSILKSGFEYLDLKLIEIDSVQIITSPEEIMDKDQHLADNIRNWEPNKRWVIGTVHGYYGEGEA